MTTVSTLFVVAFAPCIVVAEAGEGPTPSPAPWPVKYNDGSVGTSADTSDPNSPHYGHVGKPLFYIGSCA